MLFRSCLTSKPTVLQLAVLIRLPVRSPELNNGVIQAGVQPHIYSTREVWLSHGSDWLRQTLETKRYQYNVSFGTFTICAFRISSLHISYTHCTPLGSHPLWSGYLFNHVFTQHVEHLEAITPLGVFAAAEEWASTPPVISQSVVLAGRMVGEYRC